MNGRRSQAPNGRSPLLQQLFLIVAHAAVSVKVPLFARASHDLHVDNASSGYRFRTDAVTMPTADSDASGNTNAGL